MIIRQFVASLSFDLTLVNLINLAGIKTRVDKNSPALTI